VLHDIQQRSNLLRGDAGGWPDAISEQRIAGM